MTHPVCLEPIVQKTDADCGIAALAMLLNKPYRQVSAAAIKLAPRPHKAGLWTSEIIAIAKALGVTLKRTKWDEDSADDATGILVVAHKKHAHVVCLFLGIVVNPSNGLLYERETYLKTSGYGVKAFLTVP